tara:strand:+ start:50 stop:532 length:483 start_codon:yes stop_codon:yes gene_type:complete
MAIKTLLDMDLPAIARARKHLSIATFCLIAAYIAYIIWSVNVGPNTTELATLAIVAVLFALVIWVVVAVILIQIAMGKGIFTIILSAIVTVFLSWICGLAFISQASTILKLAGAKSGFFGLSQSEIDKITPGNCRQCGYSREGLPLLQECPECQRVPQVI